MLGWLRKLVENNGRQAGRLEEMIGENSRLRAQCDFLAQRLTVVETERATLLERLLNIPIPIPVIEREPEAPPARLGPADLAGLPPRTIPMPDGERGTVYKPRERSVSDLVAESQALFEDVGDDRARELGINHAPDGTVRYN